MTGPDKTGLIALFCISRNTNFNIQCTVLLWWLDTVTPDILYNRIIKNLKFKKEVGIDYIYKK